MTDPARPMTEDEREHAQLVEEKATTIGGSDAAAIVGLNPWRTAFDVWLRLTGRAEAKPDTDRFEMGRLLEPAIATRFTKKTGIPVRKPAGVVVHPRFPWATGHVDRETEDPHAVGVDAAMRWNTVLKPWPAHDTGEADVELKTVEWDPLGEWSDPNEGEVQRVPEHYFLQVVWYASLRDFERLMYCAAQFGLSKPLRVYAWRPDATVREVGTMLLESAQGFYENNVLKDDPPPLDASEGAKEYLRRLHPGPKGEDVVAADDPVAALELMRAYDEACAKFKAAKEQKETLNHRIGLLVGDHYGIKARVDGVVAKATWPKIAESSEIVTDWEAIVREQAWDVPADAIARHSRVVVTRAGYRRLSVNIKNGR